MNLFNYIKSQVPILEIIGEYTTLRQAGIYWKGVCPFHSEKTPSFTVSPHRDIFYCFGCHLGGDVIAFIAKIENCNQLEAAKFIAERYGLKIPKEIDKEFNSSQILTDEKEKYYEICKIVAEWCHKNLIDSIEAKKYILNRGFNNESINNFTIGYFPGGLSSIKSFLKYLNKFGFLAQDLIKASILIEGKNQLYSPFEERIIFPIKDQLGRFCGFGGRIFKENDERAKYYNSHENNYFNKGSILFGLDLAKKSIQQKGFVFLVEGYTDCVAMAQYNYTNCVATLGTACTIEHLKLLTRFTQQIYILYDGDAAGQKAILRLTEMCWNVNLELRVLYLRDKEDPASFLFKNGNLEKIINSAKDIYSFFIESTGNNFSTKTLHEKISIVKKLTDIIQNIDDQLKRDILLQEIANKLNVPFESIKNSCNNNLSSKSKQLIQKNITIENNNIENNDTQISNLEKRLFAIIMNNLNLFTEEYYYLLEFFNSPIKEILLKLIKLKENNSLENFNTLWEVINDDEKRFTNRAILEYEEDQSKNFKNMVIQFQKKNWKNIAYLTKVKLIQAKNSDDQVAINKIITNFQELKKKLINGG